jgi:predicted ATP-grasp superfamily ATP-dependent carboligase
VRFNPSPHPGGPGLAERSGLNSALDVDRSVPALIVKIGPYPLHHGGVGAIRTLGRLGIPVYAITEDSLTPAALSRYCRKAFVWPTTGAEDPETLVDGLLAIGGQIGRPTVPVPTDEEAAVLLAEHADRLSEWFLLPAVPPGLPGRLASKQGLYELCRENGVPTPASAFPSSAGELASFARQATFPLVAKNLEPWVRRTAPVVPGTTVFGSEQELLAAARDWGAHPSVILQEYIPRDQAQDWIVHMYCDDNSECLVEFTGIKLRSWPPHAGMTASAKTVANPALAQLAARFCQQIGFRGIGDLDWRLDLRDGQYKLVDFNPRAGAQFRLFETRAGVDVVRAMHLDLTGRRVPPSPQIEGRKMIVENIDLLAKVLSPGGLPPGLPPDASSSGRRAGRRSWHWWGMRPQADRRPPTELAWLATDDPVPFMAMLVRLARPAFSYLTRSWRQRELRRQAARLARPRAEGQLTGPPRADQQEGPRPADQLAGANTARAST